MKTLRRDTSNKFVAGVCSGVAEYFKVDPSLVRLAWVLVVVFTGIFPGVIVYLIAWAVIPEKKGSEPVHKDETKS